MSMMIKSLAASAMMLSAPVSDGRTHERDESPARAQLGAGAAPSFTLGAGAAKRVLVCVGPARLMVGGDGPAVLTFGGDGCGARPYAPIGMRIVDAPAA